MMAASCLFNLPAELCTHILGEWLELSDVASLDTSCTNKGARPVVLELIKSLRGENVKHSMSCQRWLYMRGIHQFVLAINITFCCSTDSIEDLLSSVHFDRITSIDIPHFPHVLDVPSIFPALVTACSALKSLRCSNMPIHALTKVPDGLTQLKAHYTELQFEASEAGLAWVAAHCTSLVELSWTCFCARSVGHSGFPELVGKVAFANRKLTHIEVDCSCELLPLLQSLPELKQVRLNCVGKITVREAAGLLSARPDLQYLYLNGDGQSLEYLHQKYIAIASYGNELGDLGDLLDTLGPTQDISISGCSLLPLDSLLTLGQRSAATLTTLALCGTNLSSRDHAFLLETATALRSVGFENSLDHEGVVEVFSTSCNSRLAYIELSIANLEVSTMLHILDNCPALQMLSIGTFSPSVDLDAMEGTFVSYFNCHPIIDVTARGNKYTVTIKDGRMRAVYVE